MVHVAVQKGRVATTKSRLFVEEFSPPITVDRNRTEPKKDKITPHIV